MKTMTVIFFLFYLFVSCQPSWSENEIIDARLSRETISIPVVEQKRAQVKSITNPNLIEGEWEQIAHLMTWIDDTEPLIYGSTFTYGECRKDYNITYTFLPNNKGILRSDSLELELDWKFNDANRRLEIKNSAGVSDECFIRMNQDTIELIYWDEAEPKICAYAVLIRIK